jgi:DNA-binding transcriptional regulator YiaG
MLNPFLMLNPHMDDEALRERLDSVRAQRRLPAPAVRREIRERVGLSQADVARALGVTREAVAYWERGQRVPKAGTAARYLELLDRLAQESMRA